MADCTYIDMIRKGLRENYIKKKVFRMGDIVESLSTGLIGKIIRRGTNYLISVSESNVMFKSWIHDVMEYTETKMERRMRDKNHPNYLVRNLVDIVKMLWLKWV